MFIFSIHAIIIVFDVAILSYICDSSILNFENKDFIFLIASRETNNLSTLPSRVFLFLWINKEIMPMIAITSTATKTIAAITPGPISFLKKKKCRIKLMQGKM